MNMVKLAYIFNARGNMALIQIWDTPPLHPRALSDAAVTSSLGRAYARLRRTGLHVCQWQNGRRPNGPLITQKVAAQVWAACATAPKSHFQICIWKDITPPHTHTHSFQRTLLNIAMHERESRRKTWKYVNSVRLKYNNTAQYQLKSLKLNELLSLKRQK